MVLKEFFDRLTTRVEIHIIYCFTLKTFNLMIDFSVYMMRNPLKPELPEKAYAKNKGTSTEPAPEETTDPETRLRAVRTAVRTLAR